MLLYMDLFTVDVAPVFFHAPAENPLIPFVLALVLGGALRYFGGGGLQQFQPKIYPLLCVGILLVLVEESLHIPSDALLMGGVPSLIILRTDPISSFVMSVLGLGEMSLASGEKIPAPMEWVAPVVAAHYLGVSSSWPLFAFRVLVICERFFLSRGGTVLSCAAIVASARVQGLLPEQMLKIVASWVVVQLLGSWWTGLLSVIVVIGEWGYHYSNLVPGGVFIEW